jgi:3-methyl-2-oxobutanoate hydroxymethyltransferase
LHDMLGFGDRVPRFVERFGDVAGAIEEAARRYVEAVRGRTYPAERHQYRMKGD